MKTLPEIVNSGICWFFGHDWVHVWGMDYRCSNCAAKGTTK